MKSGIKDCVKRYSEKTGCSLVEANKAMRTAVEVIKEEIIENGGVAFIGVFGLEVVHRNERNGVDPATGETRVIPAHKSLKLTVGKHLREEINK